MANQWKPWLLAGCYALLSLSAVAQTPLQAEMYMDPSCPCCKKWAAHLEQAGFAVKIHQVVNINQTRQQLGMPSQYGSCHTAKVGGYLIEGHVPAQDIKQLLLQKPKAIGLAVPGMVTGSPGMETPGVPNQRYQTLLIENPRSAKVFANH